MRYGAFGLVEVLGSSNAIAAADKMLKTAEVSFLTGIINAEVMYC